MGKNAVLVEGSAEAILWDDERIEEGVRGCYVWGSEYPVEKRALDLCRRIRDEYEARVDELLKYIAILEGVTEVKISFDVD